MLRTYTMRLKVTKKQDEKLSDLLEHLCVLYNQSLAQRKTSWEKDRKSVSYNDQQKLLTEFRQQSSVVSDFPVAIQRDPLRRVDKAYKAFFRRVKAKQNPGYPRFKPASQYTSFTVDSQNFKLTSNGLQATKLGTFKYKTRCKLKGEPKVLHMQRSGKHWIANVVYNIGPAPTKKAVSSAIGIDLGLTSLVTLSDGSSVPNPRWTKKMEKKLAEANQSLSRKIRGSKNRLKAKEMLRRVHQKIKGRRNAYLASAAKELVKKYDLIAHEKLQIKNMVQSNFAKSINDASWNQLIHRLNCEAENAGKWVVPVEPRNTTQICSGCGKKVKKEIWERTHRCSCGTVLDRDHNAAINILRLGESRVGAGNTLAPQN